MEELVEEAKQAKIEKVNLHKSSALLRLLALKKGMAYKDLISHIITYASQ